MTANSGPSTDSTKGTLGHVTRELVFLHPLGYAGHTVHSGASGARNIDVLFFMLEWARCCFYKNALGHIMPNLCFYIRWDMQVT
jgi:hypothetical protein